MGNFLKLIFAGALANAIIVGLVLAVVVVIATYVNRDTAWGLIVLASAWHFGSRLDRLEKKLDDATRTLTELKYKEPPL